ncbi:MAG: 4-(cytidine 5'-diphospho)-2-C-methyl-D-erythritol kinase, partial [Proteobacteria bacterium]|nr:4-(cytidine 5'-diphospho)-2-C-methyl-D-erythritol kinase [Pseudomonadota bacterium]
MSAAPTRSVATVAPAKLNLYLHLLGRRDDGYHRLDSLVVFAGVGDTLAATGAADFSLSVSGPFKAAAPGGDDNLVARAARALAAAAKGPAGTR